MQSNMEKDMDKTIKGFCPECGSPIYYYYIDDDGTNLSEYYECEDCGNRFPTSESLNSRLAKPYIGTTRVWNMVRRRTNTTKDVKFHTSLRT